MHYQVQIPDAHPAGIVDVFSPYDGKWIGSVETIDADGAELALKNVAAVFGDRRHCLPAYERIAILERTVELIRERAELLIALAIAEGGKPYLDTKVGLYRAISSFQNCIDCIRTEHGTEVPMQLNLASMNRLAFTHREAIGPVVAISAFNHPLNWLCHR